MGEEEPVQVSELWTVNEDGDPTVAYVVVDEAELPRNRAERRRSKTRCKANGCPREPMIAGGRCEIHGGLKATAKPLPKETRYIWPDPAALQRQQIAGLFKQGLVQWREYRQEVVPAVEVQRSQYGAWVKAADVLTPEPQDPGQVPPATTDFYVMELMKRAAPYLSMFEDAQFTSPQEEPKREPWIWGDV